MLEKMDDFFAARLQGYDEHMLTEIAGAQEFYPFTAGLLPKQATAHILDLGCGTGLVLEFYYSGNGNAAVTGIDLSKDMLAALKNKFPDRQLNLIHASYLEIPFAEKAFDAAVSVESLHHFTGETKLGCYQKLYHCLKPGGFFVLTDYFAETEELEQTYFCALEQLKKEQSAENAVLYHYDTPLTVEHEIEILQRAGFWHVERLKNWGATHTLLAKR